MDNDNQLKKILFILPSLAVGGLERVQVSLANALANRGYDITVMIMDPIDDLKTELSQKVHLIHKPYKKHFGQKIPYLRHKFYDDGMWETRANPEQLHNYYIGDEHYDIEIGFFRGLAVKIVSGGSKKNHNDFSKKSVCTEKSNTDFREIVVQEKSETKYIAWVHTDFRRAVGYADNFKSMDDVYTAYSSFDKVVCVSKEAQRGFEEVIGDTGNLTTIYNLLPVEDIRKKALEKPVMSVKKEKLHLVLIGRLLDSAKGQKRLIDVVTRLHDEGKSISLALVGGGGDEQLLRDEIAEKHADGYITMCGNQMNPYPFIKEADLLVCASYFEGFNLTVAEAIILGTPVISTDCAGPNEILDYGKYGLIVENSESGLYSGLKRLVDDPILLDDYKRMAEQRKEFFDENVILQSIEELLS